MSKLRRIGGISLVSLLVLSLAACSGDSKVGKYKLSQMVESDITYSVDELENIFSTISVELDVTLELKSDNTFTVEDNVGMTGLEDASGTWSEEDGELALTINGRSVDCEYSTGKITLEGDAVSYTFEKTDS